MAATSETPPAVADFDSAARTHMLISLAFLAAAALLALLSALKLAYPSFVSATPALSYGRLFPMALNTFVFGFITFANLAATYFLMPRLVGAPLQGERLARLAAGPGAVITALAILMVGAGITPNQGRLLGEFHVGFDLALIAFYLVPLTVTLRTLAKRTVESLYVSVWYIVGGLVWLVGLLIVGMNPWVGGVGSALLGSFYVAGLIGLWSVGVGIGSSYYVVARATQNPLFSRSLALAGFWSLAFAQLWTGPTSLIFGAAANWIETIAVVFTLGLIVPALAVLANFIGTIEGKWSLVRDRSDLRFAVVAALVSVFLAFVSSAQGFRSVAVVTGQTTFGFGTQFGLLYGAAFLFAAAFLYYAVPQAFGRELFSETTGRRQLQLTLWGVGGATVALWVGGLAAGFTWLSGSYTGAFASIGAGFASTLDATGTLTLFFFLFTVVLALGQLAMVVNLYRTITSGAAAPQEVLVASQ